MEKYNTSYRTEEYTRETEPAEGMHCPHCGTAIDSDCEICPACGRRVVSRCTFCGAPMEWSDTECPECGAPADGIVCPSCGTRSFRPFCPHCNAPLTRAAARMVERAHQDPLFEKASEANEKAAGIEAELLKASAAEAPRLRQELIKVTTDLNSILEQMLPPAGSTPQEQRNYYSARKVAYKTTSTVRQKLGWVCNYCGCTHPNPADCCRPFLGGKWVYEDITTTTIDYK